MGAAPSSEDSTAPKTPFQYGWWSVFFGVLTFLSIVVAFVMARYKIRFPWARTAALGPG